MQCDLVTSPYAAIPVPEALKVKDDAEQTNRRVAPWCFSAADCRQIEDKTVL